MKKRVMFVLIILFSISKIMAQSVSGVVVDAQNQPLPGVAVLVKGTSLGTITNVDGKFTLRDISDARTKTLVFSFIGYQKQEKEIGQATYMHVVLQESTKQMDEVVVVGYGVQKKSLITGAISSVSAKEIDNKQLTRLDDALQGLTSGVTVAQSSGAPGSAPTIRIRGITSINNSDPLYVVDGVVMNGGLEYLNPNDIASIEVLKDAASCAIYGTRASNGVVLVTTKKGKIGEPMRVNYNMQMGIQDAIKKVQLTNATQYAELRNESVMNDGSAPVFANPTSYGAGTDWQNELFSSAPYQSHSLSVSGGGDKSTYYVSLGYIAQKGIVAPSIAYDNRFSLTTNTSYKIGKYVTIGENLSYTYEKNQTGLNTNSEFGGPLSSALNLDPLTPVYVSASTVANDPNNTYASPYILQAPNGMYYGISNIVGQEMTNPLAYEQVQKGNYGWSDNMVGNAYINVNPIKGLNLRSQMNVKKAFWGNESFTPLYYLNPNNNNTNMVSQYRESDQNLTWNWDNTVSYTDQIGLHNFSIMMGMSAEKQTEDGLNVTYQGEPVTNYQDASFNFSLPTTQRIANAYDRQEYALSSYFGRLTYNYDEKYLFSGIVRRDGSSKFGTNNHYGTFPSAQIGWVITREKFFPQNTFLDNLKLRASYGVVGNDMSLNDFQYESIISGGGGSNYVFGTDGLAIGYSTTTPANPNLKWEQTSSLDAGFDAVLLKSLTVTFDYYNKKTTGMLATVQIPGFSGYTSDPWANIDDLTNKGFELEIGYNKSFGKVRLGVQGNIAYNKNTITYLGQGKQYLDGGATFQNSQYPLSRTAVGHPFNAFYGFKELGVFHSQAEIDNYKDKNGNLIQPNAKPGDFKWEDVNGDGVINSNDRTWLGDPYPHYTYGLTVNLGWRNWDFMVFGQGVWGNKIFQAYRRLDITTANYPIAALNAWTTTNSNSNYPRLSDLDPNHNFGNPSNFYLQNGAYFRIKTIQLGYTLPKPWMTAIGFQSVRVFASVSNLFTITQYTGYDPEVGGSSYGIDRGIYPQARTYMFGLNVGI
ncbi:SusC/RagA family TonB-linked outer membrane protein [Microbacter margulisiae]|uniref:TonB-linked SusC/RagA family outer membrane protein n=1 Tax=Microbacter margulisiae TaxID=1350067 RepID=A0A7W5H2N4_9PORP|nr:TonB-dependent receptor [Microbacter margulisiae]MBB3187562.1 TonB-linked SusC/RagA family outer membrane protein [Microbacter margulisiae]